MNVICQRTDTGPPCDGCTAGSNQRQKIKREQLGRAKGGGGAGGVGVCVNDMVVCTQWSSDVIKAMI